MRRLYRELAAVVVVLGVVGAGAAILFLPATQPVTDDQDPRPAPELPAEITTFENEEAFRTYVQEGQSSTALAASGAASASGGSGAQSAPSSGGTGDGGDGGGASATRETDAGSASDPQAQATATGGETRVATTNVQVQGVDEPDLVKAVGTNFFYSPGGRTDPEHDGDQPNTAGTRFVNASQPASPTQSGVIDESGSLLRTNDTLVVLADDKVVGYDVSDADAPTRQWSHSLSSSLVTARMAEGRLYLVTMSPVEMDDPCPVEPLEETSVTCDEIHRPETQVSVDATYTAVSVDPGSGNVTDTVSFVGRQDKSVVYATADQLYLSYTKRADRVDIAFEFVINESEMVPQRVKTKLADIRASDRPRQKKMRAAAKALQNWTQSLTDEQRRQKLERLTKNFQQWVDDNQRNLTRTGIVRVSLGERLHVVAHGSVAGKPLNQFSVSAFEGNLRIATTIPGFGTGEAASENDLYVLDADTLDERGAVTGMGVTERVYSVRYVDDTAYVVTFRRIDPFHVVDLSNPDDPAVVGKLKLPGFSSYLHPIDGNHVLGIGEEDGRVKAVVFDVSDPSSPTIDDSLRLDADWSGISESHHAFMIDRKHGVFFLPTGDAGLVVDYTDGSLSVTDRIRTEGQPQRARYVGDYLYVFGTEEIVVVNENTWERVTSLPV